MPSKLLSGSSPSKVETGKNKDYKEDEEEEDFAEKNIVFNM
jgi:hypothetical protein